MHAFMAGVANRGLALAAGLALDRLFGEPPRLIHPVALLGRALGEIEQQSYRDNRAAGTVHLGLGLALGGAAAVGMGHITNGSRVARSVGLGVVSGLAVAGRMLGRSADGIGDALVAGDLAGARALLPTLVGRDPAGLDADEIGRAVVESVAENTVDAVTAPIFWGLVAGVGGVVAHRVVNTLDAMVGHHSDRYEKFGWASARLDDLAAWLPARLTAVTVAVVRPRAAGAIWRAVRDQAPAHPSPNGGVVEAAFAAALGVQLGGRNRYGSRVEDRPLLGWGAPPQPGDINAAVRLLGDVTVCWAAVLVGLGLVRQRRGQRSAG